MKLSKFCIPENKLPYGKYLATYTVHKAPIILQNAALYILFGVLLFIGGIPSTIYSDENRKLWNDVCLVHNPDLNNFCENLEVVRTTEISSAVS